MAEHGAAWDFGTGEITLCGQKFKLCPRPSESRPVNPVTESGNETASNQSPVHVRGVAKTYRRAITSFERVDEPRLLLLIRTSSKCFMLLPRRLGSTIRRQMTESLQTMSGWPPRNPQHLDVCGKGSTRTMMTV